MGSKEAPTYEELVTQLKAAKWWLDTIVAKHEIEPDETSVTISNDDKSVTVTVTLAQSLEKMEDAIQRAS